MIYRGSTIAKPAIGADGWQAGTTASAVDIFLGMGPGYDIEYG